VGENRNIGLELNMKKLILFLLPVALFSQAANSVLIQQQKPGGTGSIQRNIGAAGEITDTTTFRSQLGIADMLLTDNAQSGTSYTLALSDNGKRVVITNAAANTVTIPLNATIAFEVGTQIVIVQGGAGATTIAPDGGVTLNSPGGLTTIGVQYGAVVLHKDATNTWSLTGISSTPAAFVSGTTTNDNAASGYIGEYVQSLVPVGSVVSLSTGTAANVTSISLTAGDWDVSGTVSLSYGSATVTQASAGTTATSATIPTDGSEGYSGLKLTVLSGIDSITVARKRISVASTTTIYLVASATFSAGTTGAFGTINARRVR
jgi:hypothetical protein